MERILVLMHAEEFADAQTALLSAKENAATPAALSFGVMLESEPDEEAQALMASLEHLQFLCPESNAWGAMPEFWQGESHVLMAHPAMRFTKGWDRALLRELKRCPNANKGQNALTGCLPVREDPLDAVCPVGADAFTVDGELTFHHGTPLKYTRGLERGPFLHPDFVFAPAGFFRAMAKEDDAPLFLRAFGEGWSLYTLTVPVIRLVWSLPVQPCRVSPEHKLCEGFQQVFGVDFRTGTLSAQSRRGMVSEELNFQLRVPMNVRMRDRLYRAGQRLPWRRQGPQPLCVTLCSSDMPEETQRWLKRLSGLKHLPLLAYADPLVLRRITDFLPNVLEFKPRYMMELPVDAPQAILPLSKTAILAKARDRELTRSHYIWLDADCVQMPLYPNAMFRWEKLCTDKIVIAMVNGQPDPTMFCVPDQLILTLAREMEARCLTYLNQRGDLPTQTLLWLLMIREHPEWFQLMVFPVERQLFSVLTSENE
ncbi:MAG: hypothetical protein PUC00_10425 [Clostridiales bacterium]|nr:hypothetical protein [Clostridiales bacterium]